ncbi:hypothetical protein G7Z17_g2790 [Cylindrodendrum hubeiense]|uniref:NAD(P)-binding protein n=1 Tax=Cylindrodendrum hubeiense TaxID=595255 RepID=A0A9P5HC38_9HYPO|nr:hypothetical protein G7Z17_g2790 [Cylindrodendrum hubeiense]
MSLKGKTVIVTGSSGGLGQEIARKYLSKGSNVVICDINLARLSVTEAEFTASFPETVLAVDVNVSDEESVKKLVTLAIEKFGTLDVVVNNAGIMDCFDPAGSCDKSLWDKVLAVNLTGPFLVTKHAVQAMEKQGSGLVINIASLAANYGFLAGAAYTASKHGLVGLTKNTAAFYGRRGIHSVALNLGGMAATNIVDAFAPGINQQGAELAQATLPGVDLAGKVVEKEDIANYVTFLSEGNMGANFNGGCINLGKNWPQA